MNSTKATVYIYIYTYRCKLGRLVCTLLYPRHLWQERSLIKRFVGFLCVSVCHVVTFGLMLLLWLRQSSTASCFPAVLRSLPLCEVGNGLAGIFWRSRYEPHVRGHLFDSCRQDLHVRDFIPRRRADVYEATATNRQGQGVYRRKQTLALSWVIPDAVLYIDAYHIVTSHTREHHLFINPVRV